MMFYLLLVLQLFLPLLQLFLPLTTGTLQNSTQNRSSVEPDLELRFGVFISQNSTNSFEYVGFIPSLQLGFETVNNSSSVLTREDGKKYRITYDIRDAKVRTYKVRLKWPLRRFSLTVQVKCHT